MSKKDERDVKVSLGLTINHNIIEICNMDNKSKLQELQFFFDKGEMCHWCYRDAPRHTNDILKTPAKITSLLRFLIWFYSVKKKNDRLH